MRVQHWNTYATICKIASGGSLVYDAGNPKLVLCDNLEECDGEEGDREGSRGRDTCIPSTDSCLCMPKLITIL